MEQKTETMNYAEGTQVYHPEHGAGKVALSSDGEFIVEFDSGDEEVFLLDESSGELPIVLHPDGYHAFLRDDPEKAAELARADAAALLIRITRDYSNEIPVRQLEALVRGKAVKDEEWDEWLKSLLAGLGRDPRFSVAGKKSIAYRGEVEEISLGLLNRFRRATKMKEKLRICREFIKAGGQGVPVERNRDAAISFFAGVVRNDTNLAGARVEALQALQVVSPEDAEKLAGELRGDLAAIPLTQFTDMIAAINESAVRRQFLDLLREVRAEDFTEIVTTLIKRYPRLKDWTLDYLYTEDLPTLQSLAGVAMADVSTNLEVFLWLCGTLFKEPARLETVGLEPVPVLKDMFKQLSRSHLTGAFSTRPKDSPYVSRDESEILGLLDNSKNLKRFIKKVERPVADEFLRHYAVCSAINEDDRKANIEILKAARPELEDAYDTKQAEQEKPQITRETHEKYKEELRRLVEEDIPQNIEDIRTAREWGDLRENAEYQTARDKQGLLQARKAFLERALEKCAVID
ncbi:MAG: hypothetical protein ABIH66_06870 [bacterium]